MIDRGHSITSDYFGFGRKYGERVADPSGNKLSETFTGVDTSGISGNEKYRTQSLVSGGGEKQSFFDSLQCEVRTVVRTLNSSSGVSGYATATTSFDNLGRKVQTVKPAGSGNVTTSVAPDQWDALSRPLTEVMTGGGITLTTGYAYSTFASLTIDGATVGGGQVTTITQSGTGITTRSTTKYANSQGQTVRVTDGESGNTDFVYDAYANLTKTIGPTGITEQLGYDRRGRKISLTNPDTGAWTYDYDGVGQLVRQTDAKGQATLMFYDALGRVIERREHPGSELSTTPFVTVSSYDLYADGSACANGIGKLCEVRTATVTRGSVGGLLSNPETRKYSVFDSGGRAYKGVTLVDGRTFESITTFDANGRVDKLVYPSGYMVVHHYTTWSGQLDQVNEWTGSGNGALHWLASTRFADGQIQQETVGNLVTTKTYDGFGRVATLSTNGGAIQNASYAFDVLSNLTSRSDPAAGQASQSFAYDRLNRVTSYGGVAATYLADGNINVRAGSTYSYFGGTHRLSAGAGNTYSSYDANGNVASISNAGGTRTLTYTAFNLPTGITGPSGATAYLYDGAHARIREVSSGAASSGTTYYLGGYEEHTRSDNVVEQRHYLSTPEGAIGTYTIRSDGTKTPRYWHKDHLGSIAVIVDGSGVVTEKFTFDAWGNRTQVTLSGDPYAEERGYTGHEQLVEVGLVHMNGRIYDPVTGRFLQGDPLIQDPLNGQSYNRYSYVLNNPLSLTDPSGFSWWTKWGRTALKTIGAVVAAIYGQEWLSAELMMDWAGGVATDAAFAGEQAAAAETANFVGSVAGGFAAGGIQGGNIQSAVQGAVFASLNFGIGSLTAALPGSDLDRYAASVSLHAGLGCAQQATAGGSCRGGALAGGFSAGAGPLVSGPPAYKLVAVAVIGGTASRLGGGKFENGAMTAAFVYLFSECAAAKNSCTPDNLLGSVTDAAGKVWTLPNTLIGVGVGLLGVPLGSTITFGNNAIQFEEYPWGTSALTLGNSIIYGGGTSPGDLGQLYGDPRLLNIGLHEMGHTYQYQVLGPFFVPVYFFTGGISGRNPFERAANEFAGGGSWWPK